MKSIVLKCYFKKRAAVNKTVLLIMILTGGCHNADNQPQPLAETMQALARAEAWPAILNHPEAGASENLMVRHCVNRALLHQDLLSSRFFEMRQSWGQQSLFLPQEYGYLFPLLISDLYYDAGHLNAALYWAFEAQAIHSENPHVYERLTTIYLLKGKSLLAKRYLKGLERLQGDTEKINRCRLMLTHPEMLMQDDKLSRLYNYMPVRDFIIHNAFPEDDMLNLLKANPQNKQAFELLMVLYLCQKKLALFVEQLHRLNGLKYAAIPRHFEEAVLLYLYRHQAEEIPVRGYQISPERVKAFKQYLRILQKHKGDTAVLKALLKRQFSDTYWYYFMYGVNKQKIKNLPSLIKR